jgi:hypothetical protein
LATCPEVNPNYTPVDSSRHVTTGSNGLNCNGYILVALGVILLIGSLVTSGCLYPQISYWSLVFGGVGLIIGLGLITIALYSCKTSSQSDVQEQSNLLDKDETSRSKPLGRKSIDSIAPQVKAPLIDVSENNDKNISHQRLVGQSKIPTRASDIDLPKNLPKDIPSMCDISGTTWLTNIHLYSYMTYLATRFPEIVALNTSQMAYQSREGSSIDSLTKYIFEYFPKEINNFNNLNIPFHLHVSNNHWTLVYIDRDKRTVEYYDSKEHYGNHHEIVQKLTTVADTLSQQEPNKPPYTFVLKINKVLQPDSYQCGPWMLFFLENRLINPDFDFNQLDVNEAQELIKKYRIKIMLKLIEMNNAHSAIRQQEQKNYLQFYKNETLADEMYETDLDKMSYIDRWTQILNGRSLVPGQ